MEEAVVLSSRMENAFCFKETFTPEVFMLKFGHLCDVDSQDEEGVYLLISS